MKHFISYINPMAHLGEGKYSVYFPLLTNLLVCIISEWIAYGVLHNPNSVGSYIIFIHVALILYFAFRDGIRGGFIATSISIMYYFYIIYTRHFQGAQLQPAIETTMGLMVVYFFLAFVVGWLKQGVDSLIERVSDGKRRLETIIAQLPVGVLITDSEGRLLERNRQADQILGVKIPIGFKVGEDSLKEEKIDGKPVVPSQAPLAIALRTGKPVIGKEMVFERRDKKIVHLQVSSAPILSAKKHVIAAASIITDITRQKELEQQKDNFLGIASHELKTPVTSIKAYGQVLQRTFERKGDHKAVEQLQKMDVQINKLTNLIADLLDVTKIQSGKIAFREETFDFNTLVKEIVTQLQLTTERHRIILNLDPTALVHADRERIGQVITNLLSNAIKYSPQSDSILVGTKRDSEITLSVQDFGIGIEKENLKKVFQQFFRIGGSEASTFPGLGLGLYISSEIIRREGGKIWAEQAFPAGTIFSFTLPIEKKKRRET